MEVVVMEELKPCPFCGDVPELVPMFSMFGTLDGFVVKHECEVLGALIQAPMTWTGNNAEHAVEAWNTRAERTCTNELDVWHRFECSACGCEVEGGDEMGHRCSTGAFNYCPNCGARVVEEVDDAD